MGTVPTKVLMAMAERVMEENAALRERVAKLERVREALASGFAMKTHDLAMHESWVIDDVDEVRAALDAAKEPQ